MTGFNLPDEIRAQLDRCGAPETTVKLHGMGWAVVNNTLAMRDETLLWVLTTLPDNVGSRRVTEALVNA